jgi:GAF domain-containing protein
MAGVLLGEQSVEAILAMLVSMALGAIVGVHGASVSLIRSRHFETTTATSDAVRLADGAQYRSGRGPCVEAARSGEKVNIGLVQSRARWPEFADAAILAGFRGVLSTPLAVRSVSLGSLNLYSRGQDSFTVAEERAAQRFADQASVVLSNAAVYATAELVNEQLRDALDSRDEIGQAKGILMERDNCGPEEAFEQLRRASQDANRKLRDVAADVINVRRPGISRKGE